MSTGIGVYQHMNHENHVGILTIAELREAEETCKHGTSAHMQQNDITEAYDDERKQ
jgi:hypothetical protein